MIALLLAILSADHMKHEPTAACARPTDGWSVEVREISGVGSPKRVNPHTGDRVAVFEVLCDGKARNYRSRHAQSETDVDPKLHPSDGVTLHVEGGQKTPNLRIGDYRDDGNKITKIGISTPMETVVRNTVVGAASLDGKTRIYVARRLKRSITLP